MLSTKAPAETITVTFDFTTLTSSVSAPVVTVFVNSGNADTTPSAIKSGSPQISGAKVLQQFTAGQAGTFYEVTCQIAAPDGSIFVLADVLPVIIP